jgi:hypothetical protein
MLTEIQNVAEEMWLVMLKFLNEKSCSFRAFCIDEIDSN